MHEEADTLSRVYSVSRFWGEGRTDGNQWRCMRRAAYGEGRWESRGLTTEGRREVDSPRQHWQSQMIHRTQPCSLCAKGPGQGLLNRPAPNNNRFTSAVKSATQQTGARLGRKDTGSHSQVSCHRCHWPPSPECWHQGEPPA